MALRFVSRWMGRVLLGATGAVLIAVAIGPRTGAYQTLTVLTGSMRPSIAPGSVVVVRPVPADAILVGDVVTMNAPVPGSPVVTHRIVEIVEPGAAPVIRTQGDANSHPDPWLARIEGGRVWKVAYVVPAVGRVLTALRSPLVRPLLVYAVPAMLAAWWLVQLWGGSRPCRIRPRRGGTPRAGAALSRGCHAHP